MFKRFKPCRFADNQAKKSYAGGTCRCTKSFLSAEETHSELPRATCDLVTVYRSLDQLERIGILQLGVRENGTKVYCLSHGHDHHHHLTCRACGRTERVDLCMGEELNQVGYSFGFTDLTHVMEVFGTCPDCKEKN